MNPEEVERKQRHNESEIRRRSKVNSYFEDLRDVLGCDKSVSRSSLTTFAVDALQISQERLARLKLHIDEFERAAYDMSRLPNTNSCHLCKGRPCEFKDVPEQNETTLIERILAVKSVGSRSRGGGGNDETLLLGSSGSGSGSNTVGATPSLVVHPQTQLVDVIHPFVAVPQPAVVTLPVGATPTMSHPHPEFASLMPSGVKVERAVPLQQQLAPPSDRLSLTINPISHPLTRAEPPHLLTVATKQSSVPMALVGFTGNILYCNEALGKMFSDIFRENKPPSLFMFVNAEDLHLVYEAFEGLLQDIKHVTIGSIRLCGNVQSTTARMTVSRAKARRTDQKHFLCVICPLPEQSR